MQQLTIREKLLSLHYSFDFGVRRWNSLAVEKEIHELELEPRQQKIPPKTWKEAFERAQLPPDIYTITFLDSNYPLGLAAWGEHMPPVLYIRGSKIPSHLSLASLVGTRNPTPFGRRNAEWFARSVVAAGIGTVSGLARGIDGLVHAHSLAGYTLAVLGSAINHVYPPEHEDLAHFILEKGGTIVSQFPPGQEIRPSNFIRRNAIIAGLSAGTIVIEGDEKSGANITGKYCLDLSRACVSLVRDFDTPTGKGSLKLLDAGAHWARSPEEALEVIAFQHGGSLEKMSS